jgi:trans-2,3-dihydro-3-hydroxyanthranilate isomerase
MEWEFHSVDVFADVQFGGNPLAVFIAAEGIDDSRMAALGREFNYSEITFVLPPKHPAHTARVRIFTPTGELPFAGHPNVGTAYVLAKLVERNGEHPSRFLFEEDAGLVPVALLRDAGGTLTGAALTAPQPLSIVGDVDLATIAACTGLKIEQIATAHHAPLGASVGIPFVFAELADPAALAAARPNPAAFEQARERYGAVLGRFSLFVYVRDAATIRARMFAPLSGIPEDPATGSANAALAALLASLPGVPDGEHVFDVSQGVEMGRPSRLRATAMRESGRVIRAGVGGACVPVLRGFYAAP